MNAPAPGIFWRREGSHAESTLVYVGALYSDSVLQQPRAFRIEPMESILRGQKLLFVVYAFGEDIGTERRLSDAKRRAQRHLAAGLNGLAIR